MSQIFIMAPNTHTNLCLVPFVSLLCRTIAALVVVQFTLRLLNKDLSSLSECDASHTLCGAFIFVCRQIYNTCEGLQVLRPHGLHQAVAAAWKQVPAPHLWTLLVKAFCIIVLEVHILNNLNRFSI